MTGTVPDERMERSGVLAAPRTAFAFLTRLPVPGRLHARLDRAAAWFPLVGLTVGAIAAGVRALADLGLPPAAATLLAVVAAMLITGVLHEDGWADVADGLGSHAAPEKRLEILRDPRVGTYGAVALVVVILLPVTTVAALDTGEAARAFLVAHGLSRWAILPVGLLARPARDEGAGALLRVGRPATAAATVATLAGAVLIAGTAAGAAAVLAALLCVPLAVGVLSRALGGVTGDGYGATAKLAELVVLCVLCVWWT